MTSVLTNLGLAVLMVSTPVREVTAISVSGWYLQSTRTPRMVEGEEGVGRILGTWQVVKIIDEGKEKRDPEMSGSVWTFRADALTLQSPAGKKVRFQIKFEPTATPPALYAKKPRRLNTNRDG
ncbi:MAG TPA: hypothetical protein VFV34_22555 [Blastocatellia bacterium]|nr:hypothetical protein [Blastocatellia bacterium]